VISGAGVRGTKEHKEPNVLVPYLDYEVRVGSWITTLVGLSRGENGAQVDWPDEASICTLLETLMKE
jgi:hypothetical protein